MRPYLRSAVVFGIERSTSCTNFKLVCFASVVTGNCGSGVDQAVVKVDLKLLYPVVWNEGKNVMRSIYEFLLGIHFLSCARQRSKVAFDQLAAVIS